MWYYLCYGQTKGYQDKWEGESLRAEATKAMTQRHPLDIHAVIMHIFEQLGERTTMVKMAWDWSWVLGRHWKVWSWGSCHRREENTTPNVPNIRIMSLLFPYLWQLMGQYDLWSFWGLLLSFHCWIVCAVYCLREHWRFEFENEIHKIRYSSYFFPFL